MKASDLDASFFSARSRSHGAEWLARQARSEVYIAVAESAGVPIGRVGLEFPHTIQDNAAILWSAHVEPAYQSCGVGTALFTFLEQVAVQRGIGVIQLSVDKHNPRAQQLYERLGYQVTGVELERWSYIEDGQVVEVVEDCWVMRKSLV